MRAVDITEENLEDLLAYDDLFLDYFNAFLQLPAFPQPLAYNRLTGTFQEVDDPNYKISTSVLCEDDDYGDNSAPYGATDEERERMLEWAKEERLPLFLKTELFREYKLCKLLLRQLAERYSSSHPGSAIRGYSRQTESYVSSLSNSADNSGNEEDEGEDFSWSDLRKSELFKYDRPGSRALSLPPKIGLGSSEDENTGNVSREDGKSVSRQTSKASQEDSAVKQVGRYRLPWETWNAPSTIAATMGNSTRMSGQLSGFDMSFNREATFATRNETLASIFENEAGDKLEIQLDVPMVEVQSPPRSPKQTRSEKKKKSKKSTKASKPDSADMYLQLFRDKHKRAISAPINYNDFMRIPNYHDFDAIFGEEEPEVAGHLLEFAENEDEDVETETSVKNLEGKHKLSMQQLKEVVIGSLQGMESLKQFLLETAGIHMYNFWLDCELYKMLMEDLSETEIIATRNRFLRDIKDKYKMSLSTDAREQILQAANNVETSHAIFMRLQYDVLRRMRAYWVPRYLLHKESTDELSLDILDKLSLRAQEIQSPEKELSSSFLPSISLANSITVKADEVIDITNNNNWDVVCQYGRKLDDRVKSARINFTPRAPIKTLRSRMLKAFLADNAAGGPYQKFLSKQSDSRPLSNFLFWLEVKDYNVEEDRSADRLLRLCHAWSIVNKFVAVDGIYNIGLNPDERDGLHKTLLSTKDFVEASAFNGANRFSVEFLEKSWIRFLKEDMRTFLDCQVREDNESITTAEEIEVVVVRERLIVRRPRPWVRKYPQSTDSERGRRLRTALSMASSIDQARRDEAKKRAAERRKKMEKERRKAIRAAKKRQKEAKHKKGSLVQFQPADENKEGEEKEGGSPAPGSVFGDGIDAQPEAKPVEFKDMMTNKQIMGMFKKYLTENEAREKMNVLNLYMDVDSYHNIDGKKKKDVHSSFIFKNYLDQGSRKHIKMSDKITGKLKHDKDRPKSSTFKDVQHYILPQIEEQFKKFWETQAQELGIDSQALAGMTKAELALHAGDDILGKSWRKRGKQKSMARAQPTREDKNDFLMNLHQATHGKWPIKMWYFLKYLLKHGDEEGFPFLDKDLTFYLEVQKFKEMNHSWADEDLLKRKVASINLIYLESNIQPPLQVDIPIDIQQRTSKAAQRYAQGKEIDPKLFDDAYFAIFKELLPFWAGFSKTYKQPAKDKIPLTKQQKLLKKKLEEFDNLPIPKTHFKLPSIPRGSQASFQFSLNDGIKWRDDSVYVPPEVTDPHQQKLSRMGVGHGGTFSRRASVSSTATVQQSSTFPTIFAK